MTSHPTPVPSPKHRPAVSSAPASASSSSWLGRWRFDPPHSTSPAGFSRDDVQRLVQSRTDELEREIAALRQEIDLLRIAANGPLSRVCEPTTHGIATTGFVAGIAHELRTPLNGIVGLVQILGNTPLSPHQAELVHTISRSGECLLRMVNDLLDFAMIEAGRLRFETIDFELAEELQLAVDLHAEQAASKGLELIVDIDPAVPARVRGDPARLRQVVINLLHNAVKFTERGEVAFRVRLEDGTSEGARVRFSVSDTGIGIPASVQSQLFQPFVQGDPEVVRKYGGTGLGLAISKHLVTQMGGEVGLTSALNVGSTFWFSVNLSHAAVASEPTTVPSPLAGRHILIVDDNATNRQLYCQLAVAWDMRADMADSAATAIAYLREAARLCTPVDLVLIDHSMPGADGLAVANAILGEKHIPRPLLALLTSRTGQPTPVQLQEHAITACAAKPLHPRKLRRMLERALS